MLDLGRTFLQSVERSPNALAIVDGQQRLTYAQWYEVIQRTAAGLRELGFQRGDHLLVVLQNRIEMATLHWACQFLGVVATPLNWRAKPEEVDYCATDADAKAVVFEAVSAAAVAESPVAQKLTRIAVNGAEGVAEESVKPPGPIVYVFLNWRLIIEHALEALVRNSPHKTGAFQRAFVVISGGRIVTDYDAIGPNDEVIITNSLPYVRKIQVGAMKMSVPPRLFEKGRAAVFSRFGRQMLAAEVTFLNMPSGIHADIPYILKGHQRVRAAARSQFSSAFREGRTTLARRKDLEAGQPLTYPALILNMVR